MNRSIALAFLCLCTVAACSRETMAPVPAAPRKTPPATQTQTTTPAVPSRTPEQVVTELGARLKLVSTTAPADVAAESIRTTYAGLVDRQLLETWAASPSTAPGRPVSSPWPERIEVRSSSNGGDEATVGGEIVELTSTGEARRVPVRIGLRRSGDSWLITAFEMDDPAAVVRDYYDAIAARDFRRAYAYWGPSGPPGQTFESFAAGFADTATVTVKTGTPSRIEAAAGSRYVEVPATVTATNRSGETTRFEGTYIVRRSVVDGATEAQRRWHLYRATLRAR